MGKNACPVLIGYIRALDTNANSRVVHDKVRLRVRIVELEDLAYIEGRCSRTLSVMRASVILQRVLQRMLEELTEASRSTPILSPYIEELSRARKSPLLHATGTFAVLKELKEDLTLLRVDRQLMGEGPNLNGDFFIARSESVFSLVAALVRVYEPTYDVEDFYRRCADFSRISLRFGDIHQWFELANILVDMREA